MGLDTAVPPSDVTASTATIAPAGITPPPDGTGPAAPGTPAPSSAPAPRGAAPTGLSWLSGLLPDTRLRISEWLYRSRAAGVLWLGVRLWLGYQWLNAGYQKIWGSERAAFWYGNGAGVKGFATAGVAGSATGKSGASYGWWAGFLHNFVIPNASWIAKFISLAEILIGVALLLGLFTGVAAFAGLSLNVVYMFSGSAGVNPMYGIASVLLILAWRNAGWFGLDRFVLPAFRRLDTPGGRDGDPGRVGPLEQAAVRP